MSIRAFIILSTLVFLAAVLPACARSTKDPSVMLQWASEEFTKKEDPVKAEEWLQQALEINRKKMDKPGLAETYRQYGLFLRSNAVTKHQEHYNRVGFLDESVKFTNRYQKAADYFVRSRDLFEELKQYDTLSTVHISLAKTYAHLGRQLEACDSLTKGLASYNAYKKANPDVKQFRAEEVADYEEYIGIVRQQLACPPPEEKKKEEPEETKQEDKKETKSHSMGAPN